jgi:hypothetical protein
MEDYSITFYNHVSNGRLAEAKQHLLSADPPVRETTVLSNAIVYGDLEILEILLTDPRFNSADWNSAFLVAVFYNKFPMVKRLIADPRVNPCSTNNRVIKIAAAREAETHDNLDIVECLLSDYRIASTYSGPLIHTRIARAVDRTRCFKHELLGL